MTARNRTVYLVRHGSTPGNEERRILGHEDQGLSELGQAQALAAAQLLEPCRVDLVLSSPLRRTLETAEAVASGRGLGPEVDPDLLELRLGRWTGRKRSELATDPAFRRWLEGPHTAATPEGERLGDVRDRAMAALRRGLDRVPPGGGLVLVSHGGVIRVLLLTLLDMSLSAYHKVRADPGSISALQLSEEARLDVLLGLNLGDDRRALRWRAPG